MAMTMCTDVSSVVIKAMAAWIDGNSHSKSHETSKPQGASIVPWGTFLPIRLQARVLGYSQRPSVTKCRVRLQSPGLLLVLYRSFPSFPKPPVFIAKTGGFDILERLFFVYSGILSALFLPGQDRLTNTISNQLTVTLCIVREQGFKHFIEFSPSKPRDI